MFSGAVFKFGRHGGAVAACIPDNQENSEFFANSPASFKASGFSPNTNNPVDKPSAVIALSATTLMEARLWLMGRLLFGLMIWERRLPLLSTWKIR